MKPDFQMYEYEIYLDNAATTALDPEVVEAMRPYWDEKYGNPETVYRLGRESAKAVEDARASISEILKCDPEEIFFTSGGTEANNWAIKGIDTGEMAVGATEHASVLEPARWKIHNPEEDALYEIPVDEYGIVDLDRFDSNKTSSLLSLVSVQYANNEIGTIQPVAKIAEWCKKKGAVFHCDAVQAFGKVDFDVDDVGCDMMSLSAHKIHGPMGIGALYIRKSIQNQMEPLLHGGGQERGLRSGTLAVPEIVGFAKAAELAHNAIPKEMKRLMSISEWLAGSLCGSFKAKRNGHPTQRLPNIINVTIPNVETEVICGIMCTQYGTCLSAGSACSTSKRESHVLKAIGHKSGDMLSTLRISLSRYNSDSDIRLAFARLQTAMEDAKKRSLI